MAVFKGTAGDDNLTGTSGDDRFILSKGGNDTVSAGGGNDRFFLGATLTAADRLDGGDGTDVVNLKGDYSAGLVFGASTIVNIEKMNLYAGFDYSLTMNDGNVAAGQRLTINAGGLGSANHLVFDGSAETDGSFVVTGGAGSDTLTGSALRDVFSLVKGGNDTVHGGAGNDTFEMGAALTAQDQIDGGTGNDLVTLDGNYSAGLVLGATTLTNVETLRFSAGHVYSITTNDATVAAGTTLVVDASALGTKTPLTFNGAAETDGSFAITGGAGDDVLTGGNAGNTFDLTLGGHDTVTGGLGVNVFNLGAAFDTGDRINGAAGASNTLILNGAYSGLTVSNAMAVNIQTLEIQGGNALSLIWKAAPALTLDASAATGSLTFNFSTVNSPLHFIDGALSTQIQGGSGADTFDAGTGIDSFSGGAGNDTFNFGANLTASDSVDGGLGSNALNLSGDYSAGLTFGAATVVDVQTLTLSDGHSYTLTTNDATVAAGQTLSVNAGALGTSRHLVFNGAAETDGSFSVIGGAGSDNVTGGAQADTFDLTHGGNDIAHGGGGNDVFSLGATLTAADQIDGGTGTDTLALNGDYSAGLTFGASTITNIEMLQLAAGHNYSFTTNNANVAAGQTLTVDASALSSNVVFFNGSAETDGSFNLIGGAGNDVLTGGNAGNSFDLTHGGSDFVTGGQGVNLFNLGAAFDSGDHINGAVGASNTLVLNGPYFNFTVTNSMVANIQAVDFQGTNTASVVWQQSASSPMTVDASEAGGSLSFDYSAVSGPLHFIGGALNTQIAGGSGADTFDAGTATDGFSGNGGNDTFNFGAALTASDHVDGGAGNDTLTLNGDYSGGLTFGAATMTNVETLTLAAGHSYNLTTNDATVASGATLTVDAHTLGAGDTLTFNGTAETDGTFSITGGAGSDMLMVGSVLKATSAINGGAGNDTLVLNGDYSAGLTFSATTVTNVETLQLAAGHDYNLTTNDATVASGQSLTVDASALGASNHLTLNVSAEMDGFLSIKGGAGGDTIMFGGGLVGSDTIDGGAGNDTLVLNGDYSSGLTFGAAVVNIETLQLGAGHSYNLATADSNVASGQTMTVNASALAASDALTFYAGAESDGFFAITGGAGTDKVTFLGNFTAADTFNGGAGNDTLTLNGDYSGGLTFGATTMVGVETLTLAAGHDYNLTTNDATVASGATLTVDASALGAGDTLTFNGTAETDGAFSIAGGAGSDVLMVGSALKATSAINGGAGTDTLVLNGDYSIGLTFSATTVTNIETLTLATGHSYNLTTNDATVASGATLTVDASGLGAANHLTLNVSAEMDGFLSIKGGAGGDTITFGGGLVGSDAVDGGAGNDTLVLNGDYSAGLTLSATTVTNVETLQLAAGHDYNLTTNDATVAGGQSLTVDASALGAANHLTLNVSAETDGFLSIKGGAGGDTITFGGALVGSDAIDGGAGNDTLVLNGDYSSGLTFGAATMTNVETLMLGAGSSYNLTTSDATVAAGQTLTVDAHTLGAGDTLTFNGGAETDGAFSITGGAGNDVLMVGAGLKAADPIDGGAGTDTLVLNGDYSAGVVLNATTIANIETLQLAAGHSYSLTTNDANVASGQILTVDAGALGAGNGLTFNGAAETDGSFAFIGGAGSDTLTGGAHADTFDLTHGGGDIAHGGDGNDVFSLGAALDATDQIDGGAGSDTLVLNGDYSGGTTLGASTLTSIETLQFVAGHSYSLTTNNGNVSPGATLTVDASALGAADSLAFNGTAETNGSFAFIGGAGSDTLTGGAQADTFDLTHGGGDVAHGGGGNDTFTLGAALSTADQIDGGTGTDTLALSGDYSAGLTFGAATIANIETLSLASGNSYNFTTNDGNVAAGQSLTVDGSALGAADTLAFNGAAETDGSFVLIGGAGSDTLTGGAQADTFDLTHGGADTASGGGGNDIFALGAALTSSDQIDGGSGSDMVALNGDYSSGFTFGATTMINVEALTLAGGHSYNLTTSDATVAAGAMLNVNANGLGAGDTLTFDGSAETDGAFSITGGAGADTMMVGAGLKNTSAIDGGAGNDTLVLSGDYSAGLVFGAATMINVETLRLTAGHGYNLTTSDATIAAGATLSVDASALGAGDTLVLNGAAESNGFLAVTGGAGNDSITFGGNFVATDHVDGGAGSDTLVLNGDYSSGFNFGAFTIVNVETLQLLGGHTYSLSTSDANVASGQTLAVDASALGASNFLAFNAAAETDGYFAITGGAGGDRVTFAGNFTAADAFDGGAGSDTLSLNGDYSSGLTLGATTIANVETLSLAAGNSYNLTTADGNVASGATMTVDASALGAANALTFNGIAESDGSFSFLAGSGNDVLTGGAQADSFTMTLGGNDTVHGGGGNDIFNFGATLTASDSIDGGTGNDTLNISGSGYSSFTFGAATITNVEKLVLGSNDTYGLTFNDANVAAGQTLSVDGSAIAIGKTLTLDFSADTDGIFDVVGGHGFTNAIFGSNFVAADQYTGGSGSDRLTLNGDYSAGLTFGANTLVNVLQLLLDPGHSYNLTTNDANIAAGGEMIVTASNLGAGDTLVFDGSAETNGAFLIASGAGNDTIKLGAAFNSNSSVNGGAGSDTLSLSGDYSAGMTFSMATVVSVETLQLGGGHSYKFTTNDATVASGATLTVDASALGAGDTLTFNGAAETNGTFAFVSNAGKDTLTGGAGNDSFALGASLVAADVINGGAGSDTVSLNGDYSAGVTLTATTLTNIETVAFAAGHSYSITTNEGTVTSGNTLTVDASALGALDSLTFNASADTDGVYSFKAGAGNDTLTGGGNNDVFSFGANLTAADKIDGGAGTDLVTLNGDYSAGLVFNATTMVNVEQMSLAAGHNYNLTTNDATVASGKTLTVDASGLSASNTLTFDGSAETNGFFVINGGAGNDTITLGAGFKPSDSISGGAGTDTLILNGDVSSGTVTMTGIEVFRFIAGHNYSTNITDTGTTGVITVDGSALGAANTLTFGTGASTTAFAFTGGAGNDHLTAGGSTVADSFDMTHGGDDYVLGGFGSDTFNFGATLTAADHVDGGSGTTDTLTLNGDYSAGLTLGATTIANIDLVQLAAGHSYTITTNDGNLASNASMTWDGSQLGSGDTLIFDSSAETNGFITVKGGAGNDVVTTGDSANIDFSAGGNDTLHGGGGGDTIQFGATLNNSDYVDGGGGRDFVILNGDYSAGLALGPNTLVNIEGMSFQGGFTYNITSNDAMVLPAQQFSVDGSQITAAGSLTFNGSAETDGSFVFTGGAGNDTLTGGVGSDYFYLTKGGNDTVSGGMGNETFQLDGALNSADNIDGGPGNDTIVLNGDYSAGVVFTPTTMTGIENMTLTFGHNYNLTFADGTIAAGATLTIAASLGSNSLVLDDTAETDGTLIVSGLSSGDDTYKLGAGLIHSGDQINANIGFDTLELNGDFSGGFTFGAATAVGFEELKLDAGHSYNLTTNDATVANGVNFVVDASALGAANSLVFNGSAETDGSFDIIGGAGNDVLTGGAGIDTFDITLGGVDTVHAHNDNVYVGGALTAADSIDNASIVNFNGDYSGGLVLGATTLTGGTGSLQFMGGHSYNITSNDAMVGAGSIMTIDGSLLGASDKLIFDGSAESDGSYFIQGGAGNDTLTGGAVNDVFDLSKGGVDTVHGGGGNDSFGFAGTFTDADIVDAGPGNDTLTFTNSYTGTLSSVTSIETLNLGTGGTGAYNITIGDAFLAAGTTLVVAASGAASLRFDGSAETDGAFNFTGTNGNDILMGGGQADTFNLSQFGTDVVRGGGGDDIITMGNTFGVSDQIDGGTGNDTLTISYAAGPLLFSPLTVTNIETFDLLANGSAKYQFTMDDNNVAAGATMTIDASAVRSTDVVSIDASAETDGSYHFIGGVGADTFKGGAGADIFDLTKGGNDTVWGMGGADSITAVYGTSDIFGYAAVSNSTSTGYDTITNVDFSRDKFNVSTIGAVTGVDATVTTGALSTATFDSDLASDVGAGQLAAHHAMLFVADSGTLAGHMFLVIDENGVAGYQAGQDLVIDVTSHNGSLSTADFM